MRKTCLHQYKFHTVIISANPQAKEISGEITAGGWGGSGGGGAAPLLPQVTQSITT